ncbi:MAG TPA: zinc metalloprotease HtpX [Actinomycetes bacterium]
MNRYTNGLKTVALLALLSGLILLAGAWIGGRTGLVVAFGIAAVTNAYTYFNSDKLALRSMRAYPVTSAQQPLLYRVVQDLSMASGQPMPALYVSPTDAPNAFATGRSPEHAAVCCTEGILALLDERELRGVLGHELSHVYNRDILISSVAAAMASGIMLLAQFSYFLNIFGGGGGGGRDQRSNPLGALLVVILGPIAASLVQLAISRSREYQADESGGRLTHDPLALASALAKLESGTAQRPLAPTPAVQTTSALMIANPFNAGGMSQLFSTHPPLPERIARLQALARELNA